MSPGGFACIHSTRDVGGFCFSYPFPPQPVRYDVTDEATEAERSEESHPKWLNPCVLRLEFCTTPPRRAGLDVPKANVDPILMLTANKKQEGSKQEDSERLLKTLSTRCCVLDPPLSLSPSPSRFLPQRGSLQVPWFLPFTRI